MNTNEERKRTTRLTRAVLSVISALMLFSLLVLFTFAADSTSPYDAQFGELYYENLADAIDAANSSASGGTVTVLRDVNLAECLTISKNVTLTGKYTIYRADSYTAGLFTVDAGATLTLDAGITVDGGNEWVFDLERFNQSYLANGTDMTGTVYVTPESGAPVATAPMFTINGTVIMNRATVRHHYSSTQNPPFLVSGGSLVMNDGALATENANTGGAAVVYTKAGGTFTMNDGVEICYNYSNAADSGIVYALDSTITMNGGDVHHNYQTRCAGVFLDLDGTTTAVMSGGHIHDNTQVVVKGKVGGVIYTDAVSFTMNGGVIERNYSNGATCIYADGACVLYLNAGTIRQENRAVIDNYTLLTTGVARVGENMLIEGAWIRFSHNDFAIDGEISSRVQFRNITEAANITGVINGDIGFTGTINTDFSSGTYNGNFIIPTNTSIVISGGVYNGAFSVADGADFSIRGGRFKQNPTEYLADGAEAFYDAETGLYTVYSGNVASFGGAEYATLAEAIAAANAVGGGEVSLLRSTYISEQIYVSSNITLTGDYIISRAKAPLENYTGTLFNVAAGATLTLDGGITIDGGNNWVLDEEKVKAEWHDDATSGTYVTPETGAPVATGHMFYVAGNVVLNDAIVQNQYSASYSAFQLVSPGVLTMNDGAKITHNCKMNNNVAVILPAGAEWIINEGAEVSHNFAKGNGGLATTNGNLTMNGGEIHHNINHTGSGSFLMMHGAGNLTINDCYVHHNLAFGGGWGCTIYIHSGSTGTMTMNDGLFEDNFSSRTSTIVKGSNNSTLNLNGGTIVQERTDGYYKDKVNMTDYKDGYAGYYSGNVYFGEDMTVTGWRTIFNANAENYGRIETDVYLAGATTTYSGSGTVTGDIYVSGANTAINGGVWEGEFIVADGAALSITGGLFKNDPSAYLADCYEAVYDEASGFYTVKKYYEASFDGVDYVTLEEAIAAANTAGGGTVTLIHDVDLDSSITLSSDILFEGAYSVVRSDSYTGNLFTVAADCTLTLDGGITVDGGNEWVLDYDAMYTKMMSSPSSVSSLTLVTPEAGAPVATDYMFKVNGNVILNNAVVQNNYGKVLTSVFSVASGANVTLNSGAKVTHNASINVTNENKFNASVAYVANGGVLVMNDGADISYNHMVGDNATLAYLHGDFIVNGGDIHNNSSINCGGLVAILDTTGVLTVNDGHIYENTNLVKNGANAAGAIFVYGASKFIMNGGLIEKNYSSGTTVIYAYSASSVELNGGTIRQEQRATHSGYSSYIAGAFTMGEDMTIEGGSLQIQKPFSSNATFDCDVWLGGTSTVSNGTFNHDLRAVVSTTISGGRFLGNITVDSEKTLSITGGLFKNDPSAYLADYYEVIYDEASGFYTVNKYYEASFGGVNYDSLEEAIAAANTAGGGTVTLIHDVDLDSSITVSSDILLEGAYSVVRSDSYTGNLFTVAAGATLTLDGGITVDGGNEWTIDYELLNECMLANGSTSVATSFVTPEAGAPVATDYMFNISGSVIMNNAIVKNNYQTTGEASPFYVASGATLTMNDGAVATHNCSFGGNSVARIPSGAEWAINEGAEVSYNHAEAGNGGVAYVNGHVIMNGGEVHHNTLYTGAGSFLILHSGGKLTMNDGSIHDNTNVIIGNVTSATIYVHGNGTFIMNGGVIEKNLSNRTSTVYAYASTSVVELNAGIIRHEDNTVTSAASSYFAGRTVIGENVVIDGGIIRFYKVTDYKVDGQLNCELQLARTTADLNIGGTLNGRLLVYDKSNITVTGGTYLGGFKIYSGVTFEIEGGSFRENPTDWTAEGYHPVYSNETELYTVILTPVASIDGAKYDTLAEAVAAAEDGDVINVIASHKLADSVTIDKAVTVDMKNQTITLKPEAAVAFVIEAEATFRGDGTVNTDNGNSKVFVIGSESVAGSLTIEDGSYIGESTVAAVENGSLNITGGDFAVNPDVAEGETADHSALLTVSDSANAHVAITGGRFRSFNPESAGGGYLEDSHDAAEESGDYYNVLAHLFEHYVSDGNATCTADGTKTAKCKYCELTNTITEVGSMLQHAFLHYVSDGNATCTADGTKTAKCEHCDVTVTVTDARSALGHVFENYVSDGNATCEANGTRTAKCEHCDETRTIMEARTKLPHTYDGLTCTACGHLRIWLVAIIAFCIVALLMFLPLMII